MEAHLELFSRIFIDERRAVNGVLFDFSWQRNRSNYLGVKTQSSVDDLFYRSIKNLVLVSTHANTQFLRVSRCGLLFRCAFYGLFSCSCHVNVRLSLGDDLSDHAGTYGLAALANSERLLFLKCYWSYQLHFEGGSVTRHNHLYAVSQSNLAGYVSSTYIELWFVTSEKWCVTTSFVLR